MKEQIIAWTNLEKETKEHFLMVSLLVVYCLMDGVLTQINLQKGAVELNPILNFFIENSGITSIYLVKFVMLTMVFMTLEILRRKGQTVKTKRLLLFANGLYCLVCVVALVQTVAISFVA